VYIAWGNPTHISIGVERNGPFTNWIYTQTQLGADNGRFGAGMGGLQQYSLDRYGYASGSIPVGPNLQAVEFSGPEEVYRTARFEHDRVTSFERLDPRSFTPPVAAAAASR
jgi:hypothetical protein